jgi:hypothetical protein
VSKEERKGDLGVRDIRLVNFSVLAKWRWCLLQPGLPLWKEVLVARYGTHILYEADWLKHRIPTSASKWWKNIVALDNVVPGKNWFLEAMVRKISNDLSTSFWNVKWIVEAPLAFTSSVNFSLEDDGWRRLVGEEGEFSVKSSNNYLVEDLVAEEEEDGALVNVLAQIWESPAPSKL